MVQTLLLDITRWLWYDIKRKKPTLQIKILESVALCGRLSVSLADFQLKNHHHPEIWHSFKILEKKGLIKTLADSNPGRGELIGSGRRKIYYGITENGLFAFIATLADTTADTVKPDPKKFWKAVIGFCHYNPKQVTLDKVEAFYQLFTRVYFKYSSGHGYFFQLDLFNQMCSKWIENNTLSSSSASNNNNNISLAQKILEILVLNPRITLHELATKTDESEKHVKKVIKEYSSFPNYQPYYFLVHDDEYFDANTLTEELLDFLQHKIIIVRQNSGIDTFELSLFGIMLVLTLVRHHNMDKLNLYLLNSKSISLQDCCDKIISIYYSYKKVLPLIFGKWNPLKDILKILSAYNFDVIINKEARTKRMSSSVITNGNKEFYEGIIEVAFHNRKQLIEVLDAGLDVFNSYKSDVDDSTYAPLKEDYNPITQSTMDDDDNCQKAIAVYQKLVELSVSLKYADPKSLYEELKNDGRYIKSYSNLDYSLYEIEVLEKAFADEITFLYYLNLNQDNYFPALLPQNDYIAATHIPPNQGESKEILSGEYD